MEEEEEKSTPDEKEGKSGVDESGNAMVNGYTFIKLLGRGSYGKVKLCRLGDDFFAAKIFRKSLLFKRKNYISDENGDMIVTTGYSDVKREIAIMKKLTHQNVVHLQDVLYNEETDKLYILMEYCSYGPVMEWEEDSNRFLSRWANGPLTEDQIRKIFRDILCGLEYLHYHNIAHRDIKPENLLISKDFVVKIADFGQSHIYNDPEMKNRSLGTLYFFPPECCNPENTDFLPKPADVWALGMTFYVIIFQKLPFEVDLNEAEIFENILNFRLEFPEDIPIDPDLKVLIERMLDKNPDTRIKIFEAIQNPWLNKGYNQITHTTGDIVEVSEEEITKAVKNVQSMLLAVRFN